MQAHPEKLEAAHDVTALIETSRQGFLRLDPDRIASIEGLGTSR